MCDDNVVEDEVHFMFHCTALSDARTAMPISYSASSHADDYSKFYNMFEAENICSTGKYLQKLYEARKTVMYRPITD